MVDMSRLSLSPKGSVGRSSHGKDEAYEDIHFYRKVAVRNIRCDSKEEERLGDGSESAWWSLVNLDSCCVRGRVLDMVDSLTSLVTIATASVFNM